jgi:type IV pilus assembly protein PilB
MVGEIRDRETAQIAMEAALTGHLVRSALYINDASIAAARLIDMGVQPFLIAFGIECLVAQRLARRLCEACKRPANVTAAELAEIGAATNCKRFEAYEPVGCVECNGSGYRGRIGLHEVLVLTDEIRHLILSKAASGEIRAGLVNAGRVIAAAATIMFVVFFSFVINGDPVVKQFGVGLAVSVAIDALVVLLIMPGLLEETPSAQASA